MADITLCDGGECPLKQTCFRYTATRDPWFNNYLSSIPYNKEKDECTCYLLDRRTIEKT